MDASRYVHLFDTVLASELQSQITKNKIKNNNAQNNNYHVLSKFAVLHWVTFIAWLCAAWGPPLDTAGRPTEQT